jgi:hypothetical protein
VSSPSPLSPQQRMPQEPPLPPPGVESDPKRFRDGESVTATMSSGEEEDEEPTGFVYEPPKFVATVETDPHKLAQRQKQIDFGKNTTGYQNYVARVPRRTPGDKTHPTTPRIAKVMSKRCFDGQVRAWRRALHQWDVNPGEESKLVVTPQVTPVKRAKGRQSPVTPPAAGTAAGPAASDIDMDLAAPAATIFDPYEDEL